MQMYLKVIPIVFQIFAQGAKLLIDITGGLQN